MKTLNKVETKFAAIEDNGGGLHLAVFEGSQCVAFFSGFELNLYSLVESINYLDDGFSGWEGNAEDPQADYDSLTSHQYGWALVADNDGIYADKMGAAAQREFDVETDYKFKFEWNMDIVGFVVTAECGADANMQFNGSAGEAVKEFQFGVDGGYIHDDFTFEMLELAYEQAQKETEVMSTEKDLRELSEHPELLEKLWAMDMVSQGDIKEMLQELKEK